MEDRETIVRVQLQRQFLKVTKAKSALSSS